MKRRIALLLCLLMFSSVLFACAPAEEDPDKKGEDPGYSTTAAGYYDLESRKVVYRTIKDCLSYISPSEEDDTQWDDMIKTHVKLIQSNLNFEFDFQTEDPNSLKTKIRAEAMGGTGETNIVFAGGDDLATLYPVDIFADISTLKYIDLTNTEKFGTDKMLEFAKYNDGIYSLFSVGNVTWPYTVPLNIFNAVYVNDDLLNTFDGVTHPLELYENNQWTFATLKNYLSQVSNTSDANNPIYGMYVWANSSILARAALYANGCPVVAQDSNGQYKFGYDSTAAKNALEWASDIYSMKDAVTFPPESNSTTEKEDDVFTAGKATLYMGHSYNGLTNDNFRSNLANVSFVMFPFGPDVEYGSISTSYYDTPLATSILRNGDEDLMSYVLNELLEPMAGSDTESYLSDIKRYYFSDNDDTFNMYMNESQTASYLYRNQIGATLMDEVDTTIMDVTEGRKGYTEGIDAIKAKVSAKIQSEFAQ